MDETATLRMTAEVKDLPEIETFITEQAELLQAGPDLAHDLLLAVTELVTNSLVHGYRGLPGYVEVSLHTNHSAIHVRIRDHAPLFDPSAAPLPDITLPLEERSPGGLGIFLTRQLATEMTHRPLPGGGNETTLIFSR
jgi:serine/threonine-protein kinase RsbW